MAKGDRSLICYRHHSYFSHAPKSAKSKHEANEANKVEPNLPPYYNGSRLATIYDANTLKQRQIYIRQ
jgi:hypothetical protein